MNLHLIELCFIVFYKVPTENRQPYLNRDKTPTNIPTSLKCVGFHLKRFKSRSTGRIWTVIIAAEQLRPCIVTASYRDHKAVLSNYRPTSDIYVATEKLAFQ